ncbi:MAG TPA: hypothetical protein VMP89_16395, partial [Solirubrobacteraceae bacterium]|nr:hypothetical protein [Solirubrobacteraceae bacterium]
KLVWEHCHELPAGAAVLAGAASPEQTRRALNMLGELLGRLDSLDADVVVDCGRLDPVSPVTPLVGHADAVLLAVRPCLPDLHALSTWFAGDLFDPSSCRLIVIGNGPYPDTEITEALGVEVLARVPWDPNAAQALTYLPADARELRIAPLTRATRSLADSLVADLDPGTRTRERSDLDRSTRLLRRHLVRPLRSAAATTHSENGSVPEETAR